MMTVNIVLWYYSYAMANNEIVIIKYFTDEERSSKEHDDVSLYTIDVDAILHYLNQWAQRYII